MMQTRIHPITAMHSVRIIAIVANHCSPTSVGLKTEPAMTDEVIRMVKKSHPSKKLQLALVDDDVVVVSGTVHPPKAELFEKIAKRLSEAYDQVQTCHQDAATAHRLIVDQYAKAATLPVVD